MADSTSNVKRARIFYARVDEFARKEDKYKFLDDAGSVSGVEWQELQPDAKHTWLTEGMRAEFESFLPMGTKEAKASKSVDVESIFKTFSGGMKTNRDNWVYNYSKQSLIENIGNITKHYNEHVYRLKAQSTKKLSIDDFVDPDETKISWSSTLKEQLQRERLAVFTLENCRASLYRPYCKQYFYYDEVLNDRRGLLPNIFPSTISERENVAICVNVTAEKPFTSLASNVFPNYVMTGGFGSVTQCFPLYTYTEDGPNRRENITDWALAQFREQYKDESISKLDIFHYVYALLHHPTYRTTYAANLKRELPRIPFVATREDFCRFVQAGKRLAELHVNYEAQPEYKLEHIENPEADLEWRVERMRLSKDKQSIVYNDFLTLEGIPPEAFEYRLGNRSALEWITDQYQVSTDKRSGITNDPNRADEPDYIVKLIGKVTTVSVETVKIVRDLPALKLSE